MGESWEKGATDRRKYGRAEFIESSGKAGGQKIYKFSCMINSVVVFSYPRHLTLKI